jgi:predicted ArsR family transcriptional regulator
VSHGIAPSGTTGASDPAGSPRSPSARARVHRALASPVRTRILEVLEAEVDLDAATLGVRLDLHVNTVRTHLRVLEEAGLVVPREEERDRPGRPRLLYRPVDTTQAATPVTEDRGYRFLATVLASYVEASLTDPAGAAEQAGAAWGSFLVERPGPFARLDDAEVLERLLALLGEFGFEPVLDDAPDGDPRVLLGRCPFHEVAREHQDVVCSVHLGLMRGALQELGGHVHAEDLTPWAQPDRCIAQLRLAEHG